MPKVKVVDINGKKVKDLTLSDDVFGITPNASVMHAAVVNYLANQRQGTQSTLTRAEVRGGGRKPWRQKGTGHARQGSIRAPQWTHGGIALGPKPRSYRYELNRKVKQLALKSALSQKVLDGELVLVDDFKVSEVKTKAMAQTLKNIKAQGKTLIVLPEGSELVQKSARNIEGVRTAAFNEISTYDVLNCKTFVMLVESAQKIEEVYSK